MEHIFIITLIVATLICFFGEITRPDIIAIGVLLILIITKVVTVEEGFQGFSNPAVITVLAMFILSAGLVRVGVADFIADKIIAISGNKPVPITFLVMSSVSILSAFMNNIGATAVLLSTVFAISKKSNYPESKLLIPLSFGSLLGGLTTLIGTPPNLLVSIALEDAGMPGFRMFDFFPIGFVILIFSIIYFIIIGRHLIPVRKVTDNYINTYQLQDYCTEISLPPTSPWLHKTIKESGLEKDFEVNVIKINRKVGDKLYDIKPLPDTKLKPTDHIIVRGNLTQLMQRTNESYFTISAEKKYEERDLTGQNIQIAEAAIAPNADMLGKTIKEIDLRRRFDVLAIGLKRQETVVDKYTHTSLQTGDVLLVQGSKEAIRCLAENKNFLVVNSIDRGKKNYKKAPLAIAIMGFIVIAAATEILHISTAGMLGVLLMALTGIININEIYKSVDWRIIVLIAGLLPLGTAMDDDHTGTARWLANHIVSLTDNKSPIFLLGGLFIFTTLITEVMSNAAAAVLLAPITISISVAMGLQPHPFLMCIAIGASTTFLTPIGHQSNVLVYGIGNYKFSDFIRVGLPLNLLVFIITMIMIPIIWPFKPL